MAKKINNINERSVKKLIDFLLIFISIVSFWGIFQAWILGGNFLRNIGYAVSYKYGYGREMLNYSFYFGGLGIQRVVSTLSNSNVCGFIMGITLVISFFFYPYISIKYKNILLIIVGAGFILTFSRSNFWAILIVTMIIMSPYIPKKKWLYGIVGVTLIVVVILGVIQGESSLVYKIGSWVISTINLTDPSAAGRSSIWLEALIAVIKNPLGIGFGHVGAIARDASETLIYTCENSYLAMSLDLGIIGMVLYICSIVAGYKKTNKVSNNFNDMFNRRVMKCIRSLYIYMCIMIFFLKSYL